jgi:hypothetical protein
MFSQANSKSLERLIFSIKWNNFEPIKEEMKNGWKKVFCQDCVSYLFILFIFNFFQNLFKTKKDMHVLFETALLQNKPDFVELFLEQGINLKEFLTVKTLRRLYEDKDKPVNSTWYFYLSQNLLKLTPHPSPELDGTKSCSTEY